MDGRNNDEGLLLANEQKNSKEGKFTCSSNTLLPSQIITSKEELW